MRETEERASENVILDIVRTQHGPDDPEVGGPRGRQGRRWWERSCLVRSCPSQPNPEIKL